MTSRNINDPQPDRQIEQNNLVQASEMQLRALQRHFTAGDATNLSNFARYYVSPSPELAAGVAAAAIPWDDPMLNEINWRDREEQERPWWDLIHQSSRVVGAMRPGVRTAFAMAEGWWEEGLPRLTRTAIQAYQNPGQSVVDSWRAAGASDIAYAAGELSQGNRLHWGEGWFPQSNPAWTTPGFGSDLIGAVETSMGAGVDPLVAREQEFNRLVGEYEARNGRDIVYEGQQIRQNTMIHKTRGTETYATPFSFGRAAAIQVATPGTTAFNMLSGGIDAYARIAWDPLNVPADEVRRWHQSRNLIVPRAQAEQAGLVGRGSRRPWVNPLIADEWLTTGRGRRVITGLSNDKSVASVLDAVPGIDVEDAIRITKVKAGDEASVINLLKPYLDTARRMNRYPTQSRRGLIGNRIRTADNFVSHMLPSHNAVSDWWRRITSSSTDPIINPYDLEGSIKTVRPYLDTAGASVKEIDEIIIALTRAANDPERTAAAVNMVYDVVKRRLVAIGYDEIEVESIMRMYRTIQARNTEYLVDLASNSIAVEGTGVYKMPLPDGTSIDIHLKHASSDAELAQQMIILPQVRDIRLGTSRIKATGYKLKKHLGWDDKYLPFGGADELADEFRNPFAVQSDKLMGVWRNFALLRGGWTVRIIAEEAVRRNAAGYGLLLEDPIAVIALTADTNMVGIGTIDRLDDYFQMHSLGASGFAHTGENLPRIGTEFDSARTAWALARTLDENGQLTVEGKRALSMDMHEMRASELHRVIQQQGIENAFWYLSGTDEGQEILRAIKLEADNQGSNLNRIVDHPESGTALRRQLEALEFDAAILGGGDGMYRQAGDPTWRNAAGQPVDDPREWNHVRLVEWLEDNEAADVVRDRGRIRSNEDLRHEVAMRMGYDLDELDQGGRQFVVTREPSEAFRNLISSGDSANTDLRLLMPDKIQMNREPAGVVNWIDTGIYKEDLVSGGHYELRRPHPGDLVRSNPDYMTVTVNEIAVLEDYRFWHDEIQQDRTRWATDDFAPHVIPPGMTEALGDRGVDLADLFAWFEQHGGHLAYQRFLEEKARAEIALLQGFDYPGIGTPGRAAVEYEATEAALRNIWYWDQWDSAIPMNGIGVPGIDPRDPDLMFHGGYRDAERIMSTAPENLTKPAVHLEDIEVTTEHGYTYQILQTVENNIMSLRSRSSWSGTFSEESTLRIIRDDARDLYEMLRKVEEANEVIQGHPVLTTVYALLDEMEKTLGAGTVGVADALPVGLEEALERLQQIVSESANYNRQVNRAGQGFMAGGLANNSPTGRARVYSYPWQSAPMSGFDNVEEAIFVYRRSELGIEPDEVGMWGEDLEQTFAVPEEIREHWKKVKKPKSADEQLELEFQLEELVRERAHRDPNATPKPPPSDWTGQVPPPKPEAEYLALEAEWGPTLDWYDLPDGPPGAGQFVSDPDAYIRQGVQPVEVLTKDEFRLKYLREPVEDPSALTPVPPEPHPAEMPNLRSHGEMTRREMLDFEMRVGEIYEAEGFTPPGLRRIPSPKLDRKGRGGFVETMFHWLGEAPTNKFIRSPFAKVRYTEEMARAYVWSDDVTRAQLAQWADDNGVRSLFDRYTRRHLEDYGLREMPTGIEEPFDNFEDLDAAVKRRVVEETKDLFYDLTKKQNWADSMRFIFPFADAWQEVLSRWMKMMSGMGPGGPGQAIRNWERLRQGMQTMTTSSFFDEDQFGNMTFNFPATGAIFPGLVHTSQWSVRPEQLMFIDPELRGVMGPGTGPLVQLAAALVKPGVEKYLGQVAADSMDAFLFGDYVTPRLGGAMDVVSVFTPSWMRRSIEALLDDENQAALADEVVQTYSVLLHSQDPRFVPYDQESMKRTMNEARRIGEKMGIARVVDAMILPALPRYEPSVFVELADHPDGGFWLTMAALGAEERHAEELFGGDREAARRYILDKFGLDPVNTVNKTYSLYQYPTSQEGLSFLREHPELPEHFQYTMMMFTPEGTNQDFYFASWDEAQRAGARKAITPEMAEQIPSREAGRADWNERMIEYDEALRQAASRFGTESQTYRDYRDELKRWKQREQLRIDTEYWSWDDPIATEHRRPSYGDMFEELENTIDPDSEAHRYAMDLNPDMVSFLDFSIGLWRQLETKSNDYGFGRDWWRTSDAATGPTAAQVHAMREWFNTGIKTYVAQMPDGQAKVGAEWVSEYVYARLIEGADWKDDLFIAVEEPPAPLPATGNPDWTANEIPGPVELEYANG